MGYVISLWTFFWFVSGEVIRSQHNQPFVSNQSEYWGFVSSWDSKAATCNAGDPGLIPGSGRPLGEENGNPHQYSCLENSMERGA